MARVCVFCGSRPGSEPGFVALGEELGAALVRSGWGVVYGGSRTGVMGAVATGALREGGEVIGVVPQRLVRGELAHTDLSELRVVGSMHERKAAFAELSDAFVAIPGGIGTLDELFEAWTWSMIGIHDLPVLLFNHGGYFDALLSFVDHAVRSGFVDADTRRRLLVCTTLDETLATLRSRLT